jgi:NADP-dependent 3-hydroxy acid dehydrogenase YdfG
MYETNVLGVARMTRALLPALEAGGDGHVVTIGSIAGHEPYPGGAGYNAAKFAVRAVMGVLRQELLGRPVRVSEIDPGMVETEFTIVRTGGDQAASDALYADMEPMTAEDIAETIWWVATLPPHVNINTLELMPTSQSWAGFAVHRPE